MSWNDMVIEQFRAGEQRIADRFDRGSLLLLHTTGARSGEPRVSPLAYFAEDDAIVVVASAAGSDKHPAWFHNVVAHPRVRVERWVGDALEEVEATAREADAGERADLWPRIVERAPGFGDYQANTDRVIPLVVVEPKG